LSIEALIVRYGLLALFLGAGLEGETVVVAGGVLAHRGLVPLWGAALAAAGGSFLADQIFFFAGRHLRQKPRMQRMMARPGFARARAALERHPTWFILSFRFLYGLRTISPFAIGTTRIPAPRFMALNACSALVWGAVFTGLGYGFGQGIERLFGRVHALEHLLLPLLAAAVLGVALVAGARWIAARRG